MEITNPKIEKYMSTLLENRPSIFKELEEYAQEINFPIIEPLVGRLLNQYAHVLKARRILELGSGFGYSALWFSEGMDEQTEIICTDFEKNKKKLAMNYFEKAKTKTKIDFKLGDALEILDTLEGEFDIIFNDVEKEDYPKAFRKSVPKLRKGGVLITDNTLWHGKVANEREKDYQTEGAREYNRLAFSDKRVISMIIPLRDGITISLKI
ncbi:MAG: O-methyltransferase [Candidatus Heimdallarchaeota archaeon]|nr:O-methyltransferase [Candidatus Heimdallarchaeota archaeon]MCK4973303.1 O-methyltransferase [Candidatus Heimdallarchaeota archaeon]